MTKRKPVTFTPVGRVTTGYICTITADEEVDRTDTVLYPTLAKLRECQRTKEHQDQCGYVKVKIVPVERKERKK